jgi:hypothetical protein
LTTLKAHYYDGLDIFDGAKGLLSDGINLNDWAEVETAIPNGTSHRDRSPKAFARFAEQCVILAEHWIATGQGVSGRRKRYLAGLWPEACVGEPIYYNRRYYEHDGKLLRAFVFACLPEEEDRYRHELGDTLIGDFATRADAQAAISAWAQERSLDQLKHAEYHERLRDWDLLLLGTVGVGGAQPMESQP